jgi:hypothetical protein
MEFNRRYGTDEQCHAALIKMHWPDGFVRPHCGVTEQATRWHGRSSNAQAVACRPPPRGGQQGPFPRPER